MPVALDPFEPDRPSFVDRLYRRHHDADAGYDVSLALVRFEQRFGAVDVNVGWELLTGLDRACSLGAGWMGAFALAGEPSAFVAEVLNDGGAGSATWKLANDDRWAAATLCGGPGVGVRTCTMALVECREPEGAVNDR